MTSPGLLTTTMNQRTGMPSGISYAKAVQQVQYPTKEQAIIVDSVEGFSVQDYTLAVRTIVQPSNIRYVSRISHGRICLYLSTKELVEDLVEKRATVKIGTHNLTVRALVSKAKRIILSNVCPIIPSDAIAKELPNRASVFTAECIALGDAIDIAIKNADCKFAVFSDSLSALQSFNSCKMSIKTNNIILEIKRKCNILMKNNLNSNGIKFYWIPSHKGIHGNELADSLAKTATEACIASTLPIPFTNLYEEFKTNAHMQTKRIIKEQGLMKGKIFFNLYYTERCKPWIKHERLPREFIVTINRCRADHYSLKASLFRVGIISDPKCECGHGSQDINHIVWQCSLFDSPRSKLIHQLRKIKLQLP